MYYHKVKLIIVSLAITFLLLNCRTIHAPDNWLPENEEMMENAYGGWIYLWIIDPNDEYAYEPDISGEFISYRNGEITILNYDSIYTIDTNSIAEVVLELVDKNVSTIVVWGFFGTLSTMSHGMYLSFSAPIWIMGTTIAASGESYRDVYEAEYPRKKWWAEVKRFARFPQGIPDEVDINKLKPKRININK